MDLAALFAEASARDTALLILILSIVLLLLLSFGFAAYTVVLRLQHRARERLWARLRGLWEDPMLMALADPGAEAQVHAVIEERYRLHFVEYALEFARRVKGEELDTVRRLAEPYLEPIAQRALSQGDERRTRAVQTLGTLGLPKYADVVVAALDDPSPLVGMVAARALAKEEFPEYAGAVLKRLRRFDTWSEGFLTSMLSAIGTEGARALRATLEDPDEAPWVRGVAARALTELSDLHAGQIAARVVAKETDPKLVAPALALLAEVGSPAHAAVVRDQCGAPDALVRSRALRALGTLGDSEDRARLVEALSDPSPWVALSAARALLIAGAPEALAAVRDSDHPRAALAQQVLLEGGVA